VEYDKVEGIILVSRPFRERDRLLTLFSKEMGLLKLIALRVGGSKKIRGLFVDPLSKGEFIFKKRDKSDLFPLKEGSLLDPFLHLREDYSLIEAAGNMANALLRTQSLQKPAPHLYQLFTYLLQKLNFSVHPDLITTIFQLRLLKHEGLFSIDHLPFKATKEEIEQLKLLTFEPDFEKIRGIYIQVELKEKIRLENFNL